MGVVRNLLLASPERRVAMTLLRRRPPRTRMPRPTRSPSRRRPRLCSLPNKPKARKVKVSPRRRLLREMVPREADPLKEMEKTTTKWPRKEVADLLRLMESKVAPKEADLPR